MIIVSTPLVIQEATIILSFVSIISMAGWIEIELGDLNDV